MIFNCKKLAEDELERLKKTTRRNLSLGVIQIGEDKVSEAFIRQKKKSAGKIGIGFSHYRFPETVTLKDLKEQITRLPDDGLIVQLPIKSDLETQKVLNLVAFEKDVDVLSEASLGLFYTGRLEIFPPVVGAVDKVLKEKEISLRGKTLVVVGPGRLVGKPAAIYGMRKKATVITVNEFTENVAELTRRADVIVTGVGKPNLITGEMIKKGAVIIDAGTSKKDGHLVGDVEIESVKEKAGFVTPVPGGVGPLTVVSLLENLINKCTT